MTTHTPTISVNMIAYNAEKYIGRAIQSIINQTFLDWELIIVDDGSTDRTLAVAQSFDDARIRILQMPHIGRVSNLRNIGLKESQGDYLISIDADDIHEPDALESLHSYLHTHPTCTAVYGFKTFIDQNDHPISQSGYDISWVDAQGNFQLNPKYQHTWRNILDDFYYSQVASLMVRRSTLERVGFYNENALSEDTEYYLRLFADRFDGVHFIPKSVYKHRIHITSISNDMSRLPEALNRISSNVNEFFHVIHDLAGLNYPKSALVSKQYKRHLSTQLTHKNYHAIPLIYRHALSNPEMPLSSLIFITLLEGSRFMLPGFFHSLVRPVGRKLKKLFIHESRFQKRVLTP